MAIPHLPLHTIIFLLTTYGVHAASSPSCTNDCAPFIPGVVAYWPMTSGSNESDLSGNGNHAIFVGLTYTDGPSEDNDGAIHFNGSSDSYAKVTNSPSMDVGKYPGFSFSGYVRYLGIQNKSASLIDWSGNGGYGVFIGANSEQIIQLHLYPNKVADQHKAEFSNHTLINGSWHFIGISYDKATGDAKMFKDGKLDVKQLDKNIAAGTDKTSAVGLGIDPSDKTKFNYKGDMSCMMLFKFALTEDDFKRVMDFCRTTEPTQTLLPNITVSNITTTSAIASWTKSPGIFSGYNITIERKDGEQGLEIVHPKFILSSSTILQSVLNNLVPGATYRVRVWHMHGDIRGRARSSAWFDATPIIPHDAVAYWPMTLETNGSDLSGNDNHATCVGLTYTGGPTGEESGAAHFNGSSNSYAKVKNSPSMDIGKYPGFSFSGYVRYLGIENKSAALIDWSGKDGYGVFIVVSSEHVIQLYLYPSQRVDQHKAEFPNHKLKKGAWHFIGLSYDKATGHATMFKDGKFEEKPLGKNIVAGSDKTREIGIGKDMPDGSTTEFNYNGDMSCMMLFRFALKEDDFNRVWEFCNTTNSRQTEPSLVVDSNSIIFSEITATSATVSWKAVTGNIDAYSVDISPTTGGATADPSTVPRGTTTTSLQKLSPGSTYIITVRTMVGSRTSSPSTNSFRTLEHSLVVESYSIIFSEINATSAKVSWKDVTGNYDGYSVDISPTTGGAKADPSTVPRGTTTTSLRNLSPGSIYIIAIRTKIGSRTSSQSVRAFQTLADPSTVSRGTTTTSLLTNRTIVGLKTSSPSMNSFQTPDLPTAETPKFPIGAVLTGAVIGILIVLAVSIGVLVKYIKRKKCFENIGRDSEEGADMPMLDRPPNPKRAPSPVGESDSNTFSNIKADSSNVNSKKVSGELITNTVDNSPTTGGAKALRTQAQYQE